MCSLVRFPVGLPESRGGTGESPCRQLSASLQTCGSKRWWLWRRPCEVDTPTPDEGSEPEKIAPPRAEAKEPPAVPPAIEAAVGGLLEKPQIAGYCASPGADRNERKDRASRPAPESSRHPDSCFPCKASVSSRWRETPLGRNAGVRRRDRLPRRSCRGREPRGCGASFHSTEAHGWAARSLLEASPPLTAARVSPCPMPSRRPPGIEAAAGRWKVPPVPWAAGRARREAAPQVTPTPRRRLRSPVRAHGGRVGLDRRGRRQAELSTRQ